MTIKDYIANGESKMGIACRRWVMPDEQARKVGGGGINQFMINFQATDLMISHRVNGLSFSARRWRQGKTEIVFDDDEKSDEEERKRDMMLYVAQR